MLALILQVLGLLAVTAAATLFNPIVGLLVAGVLLTVVGLALERADAE